MKAVACISKNGGLGKDGALLFHIPDDLHRFRDLTIGGTLIMGRKTMESIGRPLPGRQTVVLTRDPDYRHEGVTVIRSPEALKALKLPEPVTAAGGESVYRLLLPSCDTLELTVVEEEREADAFFPEIGPEWVLTEKSEEREYNGMKYRFLTYRRGAGS